MLIYNWTTVTAVFPTPFPSCYAYIVLISVTFRSSFPFASANAGSTYPSVDAYHVGASLAGKSFLLVRQHSWDLSKPLKYFGEKERERERDDDDDDRTGICVSKLVKKLAKRFQFFRLK